MLGRCTRETFLFVFHQLSAYWDDALTFSTNDASLDDHCTTALNAMAALVRSLRPGRRAGTSGATVGDLTTLTRTKAASRCHKAATAGIVQRHVPTMLARVSRCLLGSVSVSRANAAAALLAALALEQVVYRPTRDERPKCNSLCTSVRCPCGEMPTVVAARLVTSGSNAGGPQCAGHVVDAGGRAGRRVRFRAAGGCAEP